MIMIQRNIPVSYGITRALLSCYTSLFCFMENVVKGIQYWSLISKVCSKNIMERIIDLVS